MKAGAYWFTALVFFFNISFFKLAKNHPYRIVKYVEETGKNDLIGNNIF